MKKLYLVLAISIITNFVLNAQTQDAAISWDKTTHNFGTFKEEAGVQVATFTFTNTGSSPLYVTNVKASCGCTATDYTKEPIQPGGKGYVKASYNPANRPNKFNKSITVTSNTENPTTILRIEGNVTPREKTIVDLYPRDFGDLRLKSTNINFSQVYNTGSASDEIEIVNMGVEPIEISFEGVPSHITVSAEPTTLSGIKGDEKTGQKGVIKVTYDGKKKNDWGQSTDRVNVIINGEKESRNRLSINATLVEDFSHLSTEDLANAPKIEFKELEYDFGTLKQGEKSSHNYVFTNTGKSDLIIRKIKTTCGCTATNPEKMVIKSGESSYITVTFNSAGKKGSQQKTITVISNAPENSNVALKIKGTVEETTN
ncbi:DUF1573 domain-containing protein [Bacteroidales bacterium OttesenSCG-928-I21]|nr:DUF1573 domain-containing protein [Bacteroidales bacterium OttesenSCG-928-I21]